MNLQERLKIIEETCSNDNWNGYGAKVLSKELIQRARQLLPMLNERVDVFPLVDGALQFEFEENGLYSQLTLYANGLTSMYTEGDTLNC